MDYIRIDADGEITQVKGKDPLNQQDLLEAVADDELQVVRYRGNQFEELKVDDITEDDGEDGRQFDCTWEAVPEAE